MLTTRADLRFSIWSTLLALSHLGLLWNVKGTPDAIIHASGRRGFHTSIPAIYITVYYPVPSYKLPFNNILLELRPPSPELIFKVTFRVPSIQNILTRDDVNS